MLKNLTEIESNVILNQYKIDNDEGDNLVNEDFITMDIRVIDKIVKEYSFMRKKFAWKIVNGINRDVYFLGRRYSTKQLYIFQKVEGELIRKLKEIQVLVNIYSLKDDYYLFQISSSHGYLYYYKVDQVSELLKFLKILFSEC